MKKPSGHGLCCSSNVISVYVVVELISIIDESSCSITLEIANALYHYLVAEKIIEKNKVK